LAGIILKGSPKSLKYSCLRREPEAKTIGSIFLRNAGFEPTAFSPVELKILLSIHYYKKKELSTFIKYIARKSIFPGL
jgi:hypothetical protein